MDNGIIDPFCVFVTSEFGWSANVERMRKRRHFATIVRHQMSKKTVKVNRTHSTMTELKETRRRCPTNYEGVEFLERAEIVQVSPTGMCSETNSETDRDTDRPHVAATNQKDSACWRCATLKVKQVVNSFEVKTLKIIEKTI